MDIKKIHISDHLVDYNGNDYWVESMDLNNKKIILIRHGTYIRESFKSIMENYEFFCVEKKKSDVEKRDSEKVEESTNNTKKCNTSTKKTDKEKNSNYYQEDYWKVIQIFSNSTLKKLYEIETSRSLTIEEALDFVAPYNWREQCEENMEECGEYFFRDGDKEVFPEDLLIG